MRFVNSPAVGSLAVAALLAVGIHGELASANSECDRAEELFVAGVGVPQAKRRKQLEAIVTSCPDHSASLNDLGWLSERRQDLDQALRYYRRAVAADPGLAQPHAGLGDIYFAKANYQEAVAAYERFFELARANSRPEPIPDWVHGRYQGKLHQARELLERPAPLASSAEIERSLLKTRSIVTGCSPGAINLSIPFEFDSARISSSAEAQMRHLTRAMQNNVKAHRCRILIEGHTDARGSRAYNQHLSEQRALAVRDRLVSAGVPPDWLDVKGYGEDRPLDRSETEAAYAANRRVGFVNLGEAE